jgi:hypothetical protein
MVSEELDLDDETEFLGVLSQDPIDHWSPSKTKFKHLKTPYSEAPLVTSDERERLIRAIKNEQEAEKHSLD